MIGRKETSRDAIKARRTQRRRERRTEEASGISKEINRPV